MVLFSIILAALSDFIYKQAEHFALTLLWGLTWALGFDLGFGSQINGCFVSFGALSLVFSLGLFIKGQVYREGGRFGFRISFFEKLCLDLLVGFYPWFGIWGGEAS